MNKEQNQLINSTTQDNPSSFTVLNIAYQSHTPQPGHAINNKIQEEVIVGNTVVVVEVIAPAGAVDGLTVMAAINTTSTGGTDSLANVFSVSSMRSPS